MISRKGFVYAVNGLISTVGKMISIPPKRLNYPTMGLNIPPKRLNYPTMGFNVPPKRLNYPKKRLRPQLYGLGYPRQPSPQGNLIERLYVKT